MQATTETSNVIRLNEDDSVVIARIPIRQGESIEGGIEAKQAVPAGHKIATRAHSVGDAVKRYGQVIGFATKEIKLGEHVHDHNLAVGDFSRDYAYCTDYRPTDFVAEPRTFMGIRRDDGRVATRNYIGILSTVNCSAHVVDLVARAFERNPITGENPLADYPNVDGVVALTHKGGCGMSAGEPLHILQRTMAGYARHVNFSHVIVLGLGCEVNQVQSLIRAEKLAERATGFNIQGLGGSRKSFEELYRRVQDILAQSNAVQRVPVPASELSLALICGGSDGYSGISANPALGAASDLLVRHGGSVILSETPETYGAEHLLTRRAVSREVGEKLIERIQWWENYAKREGVSLDANPSPGNKAGGLTTILEKSLGAMAKAGTTSLQEVVEYAQPITKKGFVFMDAPGFDPVQVTGQIASGATIVAFTTGRGSVFGSKPSPCIKLATNTNMYERMIDDMDVNCGTIVEGTESVAQVGERIFSMLLDVASGKPSKSETMNFGASEFAPWIQGAMV
jgi:altronate hydrolase